MLKRTARARMLTAMLSLGVAGCAGPTALLRPSTYRYTGPTVVLQGTEYMPLKLFCDALAYDCQWDRMRGVASLRGHDRDLRFAVGSSAVLVDGQPGQLAHAVRWYHGAVMVPRSLEDFFAAPARQPTPVTLFRRHPIQHVTLDPGHGGKDPGATGVARVNEKHIVLDLSRQMAEILRRAGYQVSLTRTDDTFIPLERRTQIAHERRADFFVSIHANASTSAGLQGTEVYYLQPKSMQYELDRAAHQAQQAPLPYDHTALNGSQDVKAIVWDLRNVEHRRQARELGTAIGRRVGSRLGVKNRGLKEARFQVLREANVPAALVEVGYLTNSAEGQKLADPSYRRQLAQEIGEGLVEYFRLYERTDGFSQ